MWYCSRLSQRKGCVDHRAQEAVLTRPHETTVMVSDHGGTKGANLAKVESEADRTNIAVRASVLLAHQLIGSPRPPGRGASGEW